MPTTSRPRATRATSPHPVSAAHTGSVKNTQDSSLSRAAKTSHRSSKHVNQLDEVQDTDEDEFPNTREPKRRKLEIRGPRQQTLDTFFAQLKPPVKIATYVPGGPLIETINGVQNHVQDEDTSIPLSGPTSHRKSQSPVQEKQNRGKSKMQGMRQEDKRALRSQDNGPRLKSELATYFSNYEDIIFDTPREAELLTVDTTIYITDGASVKAALNTPSPTKSIRSPRGSPVHVRRSSVNGHTAGASALQVNAQHLDLGPLSKGLGHSIEDPLTNEAFRVSHKRAERKEKQMRNIEREHAMHEKVQLDRLLDGLLGHDWLRVLGITGVTEGEAKKFEPKRRYFIHEVQALIRKFTEWREEERRLRAEKEAAAAAEREAEDEGEDEADDDDDDGDATEVSTSNPPSSDLNASASRQLQQETASAMKGLGTAKARARELPSSTHVSPAAAPYRPPSPITSFYAARHLRDSALKRVRNNRNQLAFGQLLPDVEEAEFALPVEYLSEDVLRASARERRRRKREDVTNAGPASGS